MSGGGAEFEAQLVGKPLLVETALANCEVVAAPLAGALLDGEAEGEARVLARGEAEVEGQSEAPAETREETEGEREGSSVTLPRGLAEAQREPDGEPEELRDKRGEGDKLPLPLPQGEGCGERESGELLLAEGEDDAETEAAELAVAVREMRAEGEPRPVALAQRLPLGVAQPLLVGAPAVAVAPLLTLSVTEAPPLALDNPLAEVLPLRSALTLAICEALATPVAVAASEKAAEVLPVASVDAEGDAVAEAQEVAEREAGRVAAPLTLVVEDGDMRGEAVVSSFGLPLATAVDEAQPEEEPVRGAEKDPDADRVGRAEAEAEPVRSAVAVEEGEPRALPDPRALPVPSVFADTDSTAVAELRAIVAVPAKDSEADALGLRLPGAEALSEGVALLDEEGEAVGGAEGVVESTSVVVPKPVTLLEPLKVTAAALALAGSVGAPLPVAARSGVAVGCSEGGSVAVPRPERVAEGHALPVALPEGAPPLGVAKLDVVGRAVWLGGEVALGSGERLALVDSVCVRVAVGEAQDVGVALSEAGAEVEGVGVTVGKGTVAVRRGEDVGEPEPVVEAETLAVGLSSGERDREGSRVGERVPSGDRVSEVGGLGVAEGSAGVEEGSTLMEGEPLAVPPPPPTSPAALPLPVALALEAPDSVPEAAVETVGEGARELLRTGVAQGRAEAESVKENDADREAEPLMEAEGVREGDAEEEPRAPVGDAETLLPPVPVADSVRVDCAEVVREAGGVSVPVAEGEAVEERSGESVKAAEAEAVEVTQVLVVAVGAASEGEAVAEAVRAALGRAEALLGALRVLLRVGSGEKDAVEEVQMVGVAVEQPVSGGDKEGVGVPREEGVTDTDGHPVALPEKVPSIEVVALKVTHMLAVTDDVAVCTTVPVARAGEGDGESEDVAASSPVGVTLPHSLGVLLSVSVMRGVGVEGCVEESVDEALGVGEKRAVSVPVPSEEGEAVEEREPPTPPELVLAEDVVEGQDEAVVRAETLGVGRGDEVGEALMEGDGENAALRLSVGGAVAESEGRTWLKEGRSEMDGEEEAELQEDAERDGGVERVSCGEDVVLGDTRAEPDSVTVLRALSVKRGEVDDEGEAVSEAVGSGDLETEGEAENEFGALRERVESAVEEAVPVG